MNSDRGRPRGIHSRGPWRSWIRGNRAALSMELPLVRVCLFFPFRGPRKQEAWVGQLPASIQLHSALWGILWLADRGEAGEVLLLLREVC